MSKKRQQPAPHAEPQDSLFHFYASAFGKEELEQIAKQLGESQLSTELEVAIMRILIRRVMESIGNDDPIKALPLIRQGVNAICRALHTKRVTESKAAQSIDEAFAAALRDLSEELGIEDPSPTTNDQQTNDCATSRPTTN